MNASDELNIERYSRRDTTEQLHGVRLFLEGSNRSRTRLSAVAGVGKPGDAHMSMTFGRNHCAGLVEIEEA